MKKLILLNALLTFFAGSLLAQVLVQGTVVGEDNEPLIGASVIVQGSTTGTVTDFDGMFVLSVPQEAVLQISYIGYKSHSEQAQSSMKIKLEQDAFEMQEVVSLGYSAVKKAELNSAVVTLDAAHLTDVTTSDVGQMLEGKIAGVQISNASGQPGEQAQIRIRGTGSISAAADPVYVVDGIMGGTFNPADVASISVLKDAAATGIYGAAAAGGVIVVTTKQGGRHHKPTVNVNLKAGGNQALFGRWKPMTGSELYDYQKTYYSKIAFNSKYPKELRDRNYSWRDYFYHTGITQDYYISLSGGGDNIDYFASFDYYKQDGALKNTDYERFSGRVNLNAQINKWLDMKLRVNMERSNRSEPYSWIVIDDAFNKMPWDNPLDAEGKPVAINGGKRADDGGVWYSQYKYNALQCMQYNYAKGKNFTMGADAQLNVTFTDWLTLSATVRYSHANDKYTTFIDPSTYDDSWVDGFLGDDLSISNSIGTTTILKGGYTWGKHSFNAMLGHEWGYWQTEYTSAYGVGMPTGVDALNACAAQEVQGYKIPGSSWAAFVQASYDYAKRYFITATFRAEASSIFAPQKRVGYFPSVGASWLITNENFMKNQNVVSFMKLRGSYGWTGNNNIPEYRYLSTVALSGSYQNIVAGQLSRLSNPDLHWETAKMASLGVDLAFIDRVDMSIDLYNTDNTGLLLNVPVAPATGFFEVMKNAGSVRNQGIEYRIDADLIKMKGVTWNLGFNIGFNRNRVTELPDHTPFLQSQSKVYQQVKEGQDIYTWYLKEWAGVDSQTGDPLWYVVDENENYVLDANGNKTTTNDYNATNPHAVGKATPLFQGGVQTSVNWKGLSLSINGTFTYGNKVYNYNRGVSDSDGAYSEMNQISLDNGLGWKRWENPGDIATHPKAVLNGNNNSAEVSSRYLEDGSYFRLKNVTLSYDFANQLLKKHFSKFRVYFSMDNILTITKYSGLDPEVRISSTPWGDMAGFSADLNPVCRSFIGGIEIAF